MKIHRNHAQDADAEHKLYKAIAMLKTVEEVQNFFQDLCTPTEIQAMADRWYVVEPIKKGKPYRQIYDETGISVTTIARVARCIMLGKGGYNIVYERSEKKTHENPIKTKKHLKKRNRK